MVFTDKKLRYLFCTFFWQDSQCAVWKWTLKCNCGPGWKWIQNVISGWCWANIPRGGSTSKWRVLQIQQKTRDQGEVKVRSVVRGIVVRSRQKSEEQSVTVKKLRVKPGSLSYPVKDQGKVSQGHISESGLGSWAMSRNWDHGQGRVRSVTFSHCYVFCSTAHVSWAWEASTGHSFQCLHCTGAGATGNPPLAGKAPCSHRKTCATTASLCSVLARLWLGRVLEKPCCWVWQIYCMQLLLIFGESSPCQLDFQCLHFLPVLIQQWLKLGVNISSLPASVSALGFHLGLAGKCIWLYTEDRTYGTKTEKAVSIASCTSMVWANGTISMVVQFPWRC